MNLVEGIYNLQSVTLKLNNNLLLKETTHPI